MKPKRIGSPTHRTRRHYFMAVSTSVLFAALAPVAVSETLFARQTGEALIRGTVVDLGTGKGIEGATVLLRDSVRQTQTDSRGRFNFARIPPGKHVLVIQRIGYEPRTDTLDVPDGVALQLMLQLSETPIVLPGIDVTVQSLLLETRGFYDRKRQGFRGVFLDRADIEDEDPIYVGDLFRNIPGVEVLDGRLVMSQSVTLRGGGRGCEPSLWLDGIRSGLRNYDWIRPHQIEGVEVYTGGGAPGKYNDLCGTIVIWTRVPVRRR